MRKNLLLFILVFGFYFSNAQIDDLGKARELISKNNSLIGLFGSDIDNYIISNSYFDNTTGLRMVYLQQSYLGLPVYNQLQTLAFKNEKLVAKSGGRITGIEKLIHGNRGIPKITADIAVSAALKNRKIKFKNAPLVVASEKDGHLIVFDKQDISNEYITAELMWVTTDESNSFVLCWQVYVIPNNSSDYWMIRINAMDESVVSFNNLTVSCNWDNPSRNNQSLQNDFLILNANNTFLNEDLKNDDQNIAINTPPSLINNATYRVIPYPAESPIHTGGTPATRTNPWAAAPGNATTLKWHSDSTNDYNYTRGNNVWAQEDRNGNNGTGIAAISTSAADPLSFDFTPSFTVTPTQTTPVQNQQFNITNLFYWNNIVHDIMYQYGFDEVSGNFQASNLGRGGIGNDYVLADAQDGSGTNNANFATPPDGGSGRMQMYLWSGNPQKDGDVDNGIVTHEFAHGISNRLTGGPAQAGCLSNNEQMGEGWSDYYGLMFTQNWATSTLTTGNTSPRGIGTYAIGQSATSVGIRSQRYSTNFLVNNKVYAATIPAEPHDRGEIWCAVLWDMTWNIINQVGNINPNLYDLNGGGGNTIALKLVTEGLKLQPCSPGFIDGRNAILQADQLLYGGAHLCAIWEAFRRRGMGAFASQGSSGSVTDQIADFTVGSATLNLTQSLAQVPEGNFITYTNTITTDNCGGINNFTLTDTLPANVSYVSGGSYNATNRVVSFPVTQGAGTTQTYVFTVQINNGAYYPTISLFQDSANGTNIPSTWTATNTIPTGFWSITNARAFSPTSSYFSNNLDTTSDQRLTLTNAISLGANPPKLTFRYFLNSESTYDGGVLESSIDGGTTWTDMQPNMISGGYLTTMDASTLLAGRRAWSGSSNNQWTKTKVNLLPYANQNLKIRFRFTSDVGTNLEGLYVDDIAIRDQAVVEMQSNLFNSSAIRVVTSDTFTIILPPNACVAASVSSQPTNVTACLGGNATFSTTASGTTPVYQWQVSTDGGLTYNNISGANASSYTVTGITSNQNNNLYQVVVSNSCPSSVTSAPASLTINNSVNINNQPIAATSCSGTNATYSVSATGSGLTYQWQVSNNGGLSFTNIVGEANAILALNNITTQMDGNVYQVIISSSCLSNGIVSDAALLHVIESASFTIQPISNITLCTNASTTLTGSATGNSISYQWQLSTNGGVSWNDIAGATTASLNLNNVNASMNNNRYRLVATALNCGSINSNVTTLTISTPANITKQPSDTSICINENAEFSVVATGTTLSYQWQVSTDGGITFNNINGATSARLTLTNVSNSIDNNQYRVVVTEATCGSVTSGIAVVHTNNLPVVSISADPSNIIFPNGFITLNATSTPASSVYTWYNNGTVVSGQTSNTITVDGTGIGTYIASMIDANGCKNSSNSIIVRDTIINYTFIYPNPNRGHFQVRFEGVPYNGYARFITLYDAKGARVFRKPYTVTASYEVMDVNVEKLSTGVYELVLSDVIGTTLAVGRVVIR